VDLARLDDQVDGVVRGECAEALRDPAQFESQGVLPMVASQ
jgi:hypothetical protein